MANTHEKPVVLIIDDETTVRTVIRANLTRAGFDVVEAPGGGEALTLLAERDVDLIICDIMMPQMDGYEVRDRVMADERFATIPFIILTAKDTDTQKVRSYDLNVSGYLTKPVSAELLTAKVNACLRLREEQQEMTDREKLEVVRQTAVTVAHEVNNPLAVISAVAQTLARREDLEEGVQRQVTRITKAAEKIQEAVERLEEMQMIAITTYAGGTKMLDTSRPGEREADA